jgi:hypothetical protein
MANSPYLLFTLPAAGPSLTTGAAASMLSNAAAGQIKPTIPANWLAQGTLLTWDAWGVVTTAATPGNGTWDIRMGAATIMVTTGALALTASATAWSWHLHVDMTCRFVGLTTAAQLWAQGYLDNPTSLTAWTHLPVPQVAPALSSGFDSTIPNVMDSFFTESVATATFICHQARLIIQNPNF